MTGTQYLTFVAGRHVFEIEAGEPADDAEDRPVTVRVDGGEPRTYPATWWDRVSAGAAGDVGYWWCGFVVYAYPDPHVEPLVLRTDEPIRFVYAHGGRWVLVCELAVELHGERGKLSEAHIGEVLLDAWWDGPALMVRDFDGNLLRFTFDGDTVRLDLP